jgi:Tfp pilus assembly protein PilF
MTSSDRIRLDQRGTVGQGGDMGIGKGTKRQGFDRRPWKRAASQIIAALILLSSTAAVAQVRQTAQDKRASPLDERQVQGLVQGGVYSGRIAHLVAQRGINFKPSPGYLHMLREDGAQEVLIQALLAAKASSPSVNRSPLAQAARDNRNQNPLGLKQTRINRILALAESYDHQGNWVDADQEYRVAMSLDPHRAAIHAALGRVLVAENQPQAAIQEYRQAVSLQPDLASAHRALGSLLIKTGDVSEGISEYHEALRLNPHDTELRARLAALLYSRGYLGPAIAEYRALAVANAYDPDVHYDLGLALYADSDLTDAAGEFRRALTLKPDFSKAHDALGDLLLKQGDRAGALEQYREGSASRDESFTDTLKWLAKSLTHELRQVGN